jgi:hypothetical protein
MYVILLWLDPIPALLGRLSRRPTTGGRHFLYRSKLLSGGGKDFCAGKNIGVKSKVALQNQPSDLDQSRPKPAINPFGSFGGYARSSMLRQHQSCSDQYEYCKIGEFRLTQSRGRRAILYLVSISSNLH